MKKLVLHPVFLLFFFASYSQKASYNHTALYVQDLKKSAAFYTDLIGLDTLPNPFRDDRHVWLDTGGGTELHLIAGAGRIPAQPQDVHICFSVPSVEAFIQKLQTASITYENSKRQKNSVTLRPDGVKQIYFQDRDGYWIEINDARRK